MRLALIPLILVTGCTSMPMPDPVCNQIADDIAVATTQPQPGPSLGYQMEWLGKKQAAYIECMKK